MIVDCQLCGDRVPSDQWPQHQAEHQAGVRATLPAARAFERHAAATALAAASVELPQGVKVQLWVTTIRPLATLTLTKLPTFGAPFVHEGVQYQVQSMQLADVVDLVLNHGNSPPRPLTSAELDAARLIPVSHSCNTSACLRCWASRTGQL